MGSQPEHEQPRGPRSLLSRRQRGWLTTALVLAGLMLANTLYLLANRVADHLGGPVASYFAHESTSISKLFQVVVLSHTGLGILTVLMMLSFAATHLPRVWRRRRRRTIVSGSLFVAAGLVLACTGPFIVYASASRQHNWVWWTHVLAAAAVPVAYIVHRAVSYVRPAPRNYRRFATVVVCVAAALVVGHGFSNRGLQLTAEARRAQDRGTYNGPGSRQRDLAAFLDDSHESVQARTTGVIPAGFVPPQSPFFPSAATTTTGDYLPERIITRGDVSSPEKLEPDLDKYGFVVNERIGADTCARCHPDVVEQWAASAHRFASFNNPFYEATINLLRNESLADGPGIQRHVASFPQWQGRTGMIKSKWCSGCHDPSIMLAGNMTEPIDRRSPEAQAGLTCLACHAIDAIHNNTGNGNYNIADQQEDPYVFADAPSGSVGAFLHDTAIKAKPEAHKRQMLQPFFRTSDYCATCHKVSLDQPVNNYRWLRGQDEHTAWHDSGVAHNAARTFYLPPASRSCQDCHMPLEDAPLGDVSARNGKVRSHRFLAVNTALPFIRGDEDTVKRVEAFLRDEKLRIDIFALHDEASSPGSGRTVYALDQTRPVLVAGKAVVFDVVVRNLGVGHTFPGGTNDSNEAWVEFTVLDDQENVLQQSGFIDENRHVDPAAHYFRALLVDRDGQRINKRNAQDIHAAVYTNTIGPGTAHTVHYRVAVPPAPATQVKLRARLMWRKFDRAYTEFAFNTNREGFKRFSECPDLPVTEICRDEVTLNLSAEPARSLTDTKVAADQWQRFNDYGIGLLLQGDTRGASAAFGQVALMVPERLDGHRNLARVAIRDGDLETAYQNLLRCEELDSNNPQTAYFWGQVLQEDGRYVEAASAYRRTLQHFPEDRATWRNLGRTLYLDGKFESAIGAFDAVLGIDSEDRVAHYHQMLCYRALGRETEAGRAEASYLKYKIDESQSEVTNSYRLSHPHDNLESQPVHVHDLTGLPERAQTELSVLVNGRPEYSE